MVDDVQLNWLFTEGLVPLFGASVVYLVWGIFKKLAKPGNVFGWKEAIDSMGWLYGAIIIAVQSAVRFFEAGQTYRADAIWCVVCAIVCGMQLLAAMSERGENPSWQPPTLLKITAVLFVGVILLSGYRAQLVAKPDSRALTGRSEADVASPNSRANGSPGEAR